MSSPQIEQAEQIAKKIIARRTSGENLSDDDIRVEFPNQCDEIIDWMRMLTAVSKARQRHAMGERIDVATTAQREELAFLSNSFPGFSDFSELTKGGQSSVWLAKHSATGDTVVVKLLLDGPFATESSRRRFDREARILQKINHPHILRIIESGIIRGRQHIITEFVGGLTIDDFAFALGPNLDARLRLMAKVCRAIAVAHNAGVIHRDLKPSNVLVRDDGTPCIIDFGLSKDTLAQRESGAILTSASGARFGTAAYLSPEQTTTDGTIDKRVDIYSLGVVLFEVTTDRFPYDNHDDLIGVIRNILTEDPVSLSRAMNECSHPYREPRDKIRKLDAIIRKAMDKDRERRYPSAADMAGDIEQLLDHKEVSAMRGASLRRIERAWIRRRRPIFIGLSIFAMALIALVSIRSQQLATDQRIRAERSLVLERVEVFGELQDAHRDNLRDSRLPVRNLNQSMWATSLLHDANLVDGLRGIDRLRAKDAETWLQDHRADLANFAVELESTVFLMDPGEIGRDAGGIDLEALDVVAKAFDALLANTYHCKSLDDADGFRINFEAARNLAMDVGCSLNVVYTYRSCGMRHQLLQGLAEGLSNCLDTGAMCDVIATLIVTDPEVPRVDPVLRQQALRLRRLAADSATGDGEPLMVDHALLNQRLAGFLDNSMPNWKERWGTSTPMSAITRTIDEHLLGERQFEDKTVQEIKELGKQRWEDLERARKVSPIAYFCNTYHDLYGRRLGLRARQQALRILVEIMRFREQHKRWPKSLDEILIDPKFLVDPMTGHSMEYQVTYTGFRLLSPPIASHLVDLATNGRSHKVTGYDGERIIFMDR